MTEALTAYQRKQKFNDERYAVTPRPCANPKRRKRLEANPEKWLRWYKADNYPQPFSDFHRAVIKSTIRAMRDGAGTVIAGPRGFGKTTLFGDMAQFGTFTGLCKFPVVVGWKHSASKQMLRGWLNDMAENDRLAADYPEITQPFERSVQAKLIRSLYWADSGFPCGADIRQTENFIVLPTGGAMASTSIKASVRGLRIESGGKWVRPDVALLDDPQDKATAESAEMTKKVLDTVNGDILSLAGPTRRIALMAAVTVIAAGDVASGLLERRDIEAIRTGQILSWPVGFNDAGESRKLWDEWNELRLTGVQEQDAGKGAIRFYRANKTKMTEGMAVSWKQRYDRDRGDPDALYAAMFDYYRLGHAAFMAERQNDPVTIDLSIYDLTVDLILAHQGPLPKFAVQPETTKLTGYSDINRAGLHWCVAGFQNDMTAHVAAYGREPSRDDLWPENAPDLIKQQHIFAGLTRLCDQINATTFHRDGEPMKLDMFLIDASFESDTVHRFAQAANASGKYSFKIFAAIGRAANKYRWSKETIIGRPAEGVHLQRTQNRRQSYVMINADEWREKAQKSWLGVAGSPGGATIFKTENKKIHTPFAEQVIAEKLTNKYQTEFGFRYEWNHKPGAAWDWGDAFTGCWAAAALCGLSSSGQSIVQHKKKKQRPRGGAVIHL